MNNVYQHISEMIPQMSKSQVKIAKYILENLNTVPFFTVGKLAKMTGVSEATVVRFATYLGYSGYPEFQQLMQASVQQQLTTMERLEMSFQVYDEKEKGVYEIFQDDIANIKSTMEKMDMQTFLNAVESLVHSERVYVVASRSAVSLGVFLEYYLNIVLGNTSFIKTVEEISDQLYGLNKKDVVIGISFARYTRSTVDIMAYAREKGATTIAITDHFLSPLIRYADLPLVAASHMPSFIDSFVAPLSLINALVTYVGKNRSVPFQARLKKLEETWDHFHIFYKEKND
jgi:DNA-binding MurR/RpiR family transcriptional regulator